jgi:hypothetical protein
MVAVSQFLEGSYWNVLSTVDPTWAAQHGEYPDVFKDGCLALCTGQVMVTTHHYEKQPHYKLLMHGRHVLISKATRKKYFQLASKGNLGEAIAAAAADIT